jgi:c-di-GMP-binding flagellar brake protein YcgR
MLTRYWERRRFIRVPVCGPARFCSGSQAGHCELRDISPGGVGLRMPVRKATRLGPRITVEVELAPGEHWYVARDARVVRQTPDDDGMCLIGVEFACERTTAPDLDTDTPPLSATGHAALRAAAPN